MIAVPRSVISIQSPWRQMPGYIVEVALAQALAVLVAPEEDRHRRHRLGDHELADLADERVAVLVPRLDLGAERARLQLAAVDGQRRHAADERGARRRCRRWSRTARCPCRRGRRPTSKPSGDSGEPVEPTARSAARSRPSPGSTPPFMHARDVGGARAEASSSRCARRGPRARRGRASPGCRRRARSSPSSAARRRGSSTSSSRSW